MSAAFPASDPAKTRGVVSFARMLEKIRLHTAGRLPPRLLRPSRFRRRHQLRRPLLPLLGTRLRKGENPHPE